MYEPTKETEEDIDPIDPNAAKNTDDEFKNDSIFDNISEIKEILNNPSNDISMDLANFLNFPDLLDIKQKNHAS